METLVANLGSAKRVTDKHGTWMVAPMTLIVPGVLEGSRGPLYYPPEEIARNFKAWHGYPLTRNHPEKAGKPVSAFDNGILDQVGLGVVRNPRIVGNKLTAEGWFHEGRTKAVDKAIWNALERGAQLELSTGLAVKDDVQNGECPTTKRRYIGIARNYKPDHVAVLTDGQRGACSIEDGCGVNNIFCPTGEGGGVDASCSPGEAQAKIDKTSSKIEKTKAVLAKFKAELKADKAKLKEVTKAAKAKLKADKAAAKKSAKVAPVKQLTDEEAAAIEKQHTGSIKLGGQKTSQPAPKAEPKKSSFWDELKVFFDHTYNVANADTPLYPAEEALDEVLADAMAFLESKLGRELTDDEIDQMVDTLLDNNEAIMNRDQAISYLTTNCACWKGKEALLGNATSFTDAEVVQLAQEHKTSVSVVNVLRSVGTTVGAPKTLTLNEMPAFIKEKMDAKPPVEKKKCAECEGKGEDCECPPEKGPAAPAAPTMNAWIQSAPPEARNGLNRLIQREKKERENIISKLTANVAAPAKAKLLESLSKLDTEALEAMLPVTTNKSRDNDPLANFFGAGGGDDNAYITNHEAEPEGVDYVGPWGGVS